MAALTTPRRRRLTNSPFDTLERTFALLVSGPDPLALDGTGVAGLPDRAIPLDELKARLLHPSTRFETRDAIVSVLVTRAQTEGGKWTVGLAAVLLPGLRGTVRTLVAACPGKADDIEAEALAALLAAVARCDPGRPRLASWLRWQARKGATRLLRAEMAERARPGNEPVSAAPPRPWGHPDLVLAKAVRAGVISAKELRETVSANARTKVWFTMSPEDARALDRHVAPNLTEHDLAHLGAYTAAARLVVDGEEAPAFTLATRPAPPAVPGRADAVRTANRAAHTRPPATAPRPRSPLAGRALPAGPRTPTARPAGGAGDQAGGLHRGLHDGLPDPLHRGLRPDLEPLGTAERPRPGREGGSTARADLRGERS